MGSPPEFVSPEMIIKSLMVSYKWSRVKATRAVRKAIKSGLLPSYNTDGEPVTPAEFFKLSDKVN